MTRYVSQIAVANDGTSKAAFICNRTVTANPGVCVLQITGGAGGCSTVGPTGCTTGSGVCCQWTVPAGVSSVVIEIWGGGGGGAAPGGMCTCCNHGQGGGGGAYSRKTLAVSAGDTYTICVGGGGAGGIPSSSSVCCCGLKGGTTYVTGNGLSGFCAEGGYGGESRCYPSGTSVLSPNGGWPGSGGDLNVRGGDGMVWYRTNICGWTQGGHSPFGGRQRFLGYNYCAQYTDDQGDMANNSVCGNSGHFPGGGGTGGWHSCCCGICSCGGPGAPGLVRIWM